MPLGSAVPRSAGCAAALSGSGGAGSSTTPSRIRLLIRARERFLGNRLVLGERLRPVALARLVGKHRLERGAFLMGDLAGVGPVAALQLQVFADGVV